MLKAAGYRSVVTMSKSIVISSFTLTVPPAMLMGVIPKSLCFKYVDLVVTLLSSDVDRDWMGLTMHF